MEKERLGGCLKNGWWMPSALFSALSAPQREIFPPGVPLTLTTCLQQIKSMTMKHSYFIVD
jgi:hypothetical protein